MKKFLKTLAGIAFGLTLATNANAVLIDDFSDSQTAITTVTTDTIAISGTELSNVSRTLEFTSINGTASLGVGPSAFGDILNYSQDIGTTSTALVTWSFDAFDFSGESVALFDPFVTDADNICMDLIFDDGTNTETVDTVCSTDTNSLASILSFDLSGASLVDMTSITSITMSLDGTGAPSGDAGAGTFKAVPEPGALALIGFGLLGLGAAARRRKAVA